MITTKNYHYIHRISKRTVPFLRKENCFTKVFKREKNSVTNAMISDLIKSGEPLMVARYGSTESAAIVNFIEVHKKQNDITAIFRHLKGDLNIFWKKDDKFLHNLCELSGFFPKEENLLKDFVDLYLENSKNLDILGIWNGLEEHILTPPICKIHLCKIRELEPWFYDKPWSYQLKDKKVLVIHPFEESIKKQYYEHREDIYENQKILPEFELKTIKAIQTLAGEKSNFETWFDALNNMKKQVDKTDFDVAIIGCGAYGFPLASHIKEVLKRQAIHLGGVTQLLFGIKGKRWEEWEHYTSLRKNQGKQWITALEIPKNYKKVENGCYW